MTTRILSKALLLLTISLGVPSVARPVHAVEGRRHRHRHHERQREERRREKERERSHEGERHGEL